MKGLIQVKRHKDGKVFTSNMSNVDCIYQIHFCTSYTQVMVQEFVDETITTDCVICEPIGSTPNWVDLIATQLDDTGEFIEE